MYIKESPVISVRKEYAGFQLDTSKIELHTADKRKILLPYSGELPEKLRDNDGAFVSFVIRVGLNINVHLVVKTGKKESRYLLKATAQEINDLLFNFFFEKKGKTNLRLLGNAVYLPTGSATSRVPL